jgi:hypothetical protein
VLEIHHAETTTSTSQLEAKFQAAQIGQFPENHDVVEELVCQVAEWGPHINVYNLSPNIDGEVACIPTFLDSMRIISTRSDCSGS